MLKCVVRISLTTPRRSFRCLVPVEHIALVQQCRRRRGADRDCPSALGTRLMARQRKIGIPTTQTIDDIWQRRANRFAPGDGKAAHLLQPGPVSKTDPVVLNIFALPYS